METREHWVVEVLEPSGQWHDLRGWIQDETTARTYARNLTSTYVHMRIQHVVETTETVWKV